ncbi:MAG: PAS domain S-box protein, partial [Vicinamibacteria bacterium]
MSSDPDQNEYPVSADGLRERLNDLAASEARYRSILDASPDGIAVADLTGRVTMVSARAATMLRIVAVGDVIGNPITDFIVPEDRGRAAERIALLFAGKRSGPSEYRALCADGSTFDVDVNAEFIRGADGAPSEMLLMIRDITEKRNARDALQRSSDVLRSIVETVPPGIFWKDKNLRYLGCNTKFARDSDQDSPAGIIGKTDVELRRPDLADKYRDEDLAVLQSVVPRLDFEETLTTPEGGTMWFSTSKVPLRDEHGQTSGILGIYQDITERKQTEIALREALSEKEFLLSEIHHRVKNNLQVINSLLRLEAGRSPEPAVRLALGEMQGRVLSMAVLHETLYKTRKFGRVDLAGYLKELAQQFFRAQGSSAGAARLKLDLQPVEVRIDQGVPCGLILSELMSNSFKHAIGAGRGGEITVILRREPNRDVLLQVSDTGPGLPADFEIRRSKSLGMQLVADLARQIGGRMEVGP